MKNYSAQSLIPVEDIRNGVCIKDDGIYSAVILVQAINFDLKAGVERKAILGQFQALLNSLETNIQILIQSRKFNIKPYLNFLEGLYKEQKIELLKLQTGEYINFIRKFTEKVDIISKQFYIVINYSPVIENIKTGVFSKETKNDTAFEQNRIQLQQRVDFVQSNIRALGLKSVMLGTEEITELLYKSYNPGSDTF